MSDEPEMVRRVAQAIGTASDEGVWGMSWQIRAAKAAIASMKSPTENMLRRGVSAIGVEQVPLPVWRAMIEEALK